MNECSTVNKKRLALGIVASFVFLFLFGWFYHGQFLNSDYENTASLWRPKDELTAYMKWIFLNHLVLAILLGGLFAKGYEGKGLKEGLRFGFWMGLLLGIPHNLVTYAVMPIPMHLTLFWILGAIVECVGVGILLALLYRPKA